MQGGGTGGGKCFLALGRPGNICLPYRTASIIRSTVRVLDRGGQTVVCRPSPALQPVSANKVLLAHGHAHSFVHWLWLCLCYEAESSSCNVDPTTVEA